MKNSAAIGAEGIFIEGSRAEVPALAAAFDGLHPQLVQSIGSLKIPFAEKEQILQMIRDHPPAAPGDDVESGEGPRSRLHRRRSSVSVGGIRAEAEALTKHHSPKIREAVLSAVEGLDADGDGKVVSREIVSAVVRGAERAAGRDKTTKRQWALIGILLGVVALLAGSNFFTSDAAVKNNKDTQVVGSATGAALLTKDLLPVATSTNEIDVALPALAWLTHVVHEFPRYVSFQSGCEKRGDAVLRHEEVAGVAVEEERSVVLSTTMGTKISWDREDAGVVSFALDDGTQWTKPAGCEACTILNVVMSEEVQRGIDRLHGDLDMVLHREGRVLTEERDECVSCPPGNGPGGEADADGGPPAPGGPDQGTHNPTASPTGAPTTLYWHAVQIGATCAGKSIVDGRVQPTDEPSSSCPGPNGTFINGCIAGECVTGVMASYSDCCGDACLAAYPEMDEKYDICENGCDAVHRMAYCDQHPDECRE